MKIMILIFHLYYFEAFANNWVLSQEKDGIKLFVGDRKEKILPFRAEGIINSGANDLLKILMNYEDKHNWAPKLKSVKLHRKVKNTFIFSEYYKTPWPATDREFLLKGTLDKISEKEFEFFAKSIIDPLIKDKNHIQADVLKLNFSAKEIGLNKTQIIFEFQGDIKGYIPTWLSNIIQKKWPLKFIANLKKEVDKLNI